MKYFSFYKQHDSMDCGPTCIRIACPACIYAGVAKHYGKSLNIETLRLNAQISKEGVSLLGIAEAAEKVGFNAKGVSLTYEELLKDTEYTIYINCNSQGIPLLGYSKILPQRNWF